MGKPERKVEVGDKIGANAEDGSVRAGSRILPAAHLGVVFFRANGIDQRCTGNAVVSDSGNVVATSGRCVSALAGKFVSDLVFVPAYNGTAPMVFGLRRPSRPMIAGSQSEPWTTIRPSSRCKLP